MNIKKRKLIFFIAIILIIFIFLILLFKNNSTTNRSNSTNMNIPNSNIITPPDTSGSNGYLTAFYSPYPLRPYAQNINQLSSFLTNDQLNMQLYGWFYYGRLIDSSGTVYPFFVALQRISLSININASDFVAVVAIKTPKKYYFIGSNNIYFNSPKILIKQNPWSVEVSGSNSSSFISICSTNNILPGLPGASYSVNFKGFMSDGNEMEGSVNFTDKKGISKQGYGPMNLYPQWLFPNQSQSIINNYNGSIEKYLEATNDPMDGQGSIYYTEMFLGVKNWNIRTNNDSFNGNDGLLWVDIIAESYNPQGGIITKNISWNFYAIQFPDSLGSSLLINKLWSTNKYNTGTLYIATLFIPDDKEPYDLVPYHFPINSINIEADTLSIWKSNVSGKSYYLNNIITLNVDDGKKWEITIKATYQDQEVYIDKNNCKYE